MTYVCYCGHSHDEHDPKTLECEVDECLCFFYDDDPLARGEG